MNKRRIMLLVHYSLVPPDDLRDRNDPRIAKYRTEFDVKTALLNLGHEVQVVGVYDDLAPIRKTVEDWKPHIAFNLLEDFAGNSALDYYVVSFFEMLRLPYTGCSPRGLLLARDKALTKMILTFHRISTPHFTVFPHAKKIGRLRKFKFPLIVKSLMEEGSVGIAQASYVENETQLRERVALIHEKLQGDAIAEEYIDGRELYVTILGNNKLEVLPIRELAFGSVEPGMPRMATYKVKWDDKYRERWGIEYQFARNLPNGMAEKISHLCKRVYHLLDMNGYGRIDLRLTPEGQIYVLEANPNPGIASDEDCTLSAIKSGLSYEEFIQRILQLSLTSRSIDD
ncbi:MAG: ATP-grasp domain-containing protein [Gammaproteobacteria bacterium]|nr:ATP-grasp domain-containing protein [Gammaproteobacteria bacterium]